MALKKDEKNQPKNSSMVNNEKEMEEHGKIMEQMKTNKEVKEKDGERPDPKQHNND